MKELSLGPEEFDGNPTAGSLSTPAISGNVPNSIANIQECWLNLGEARMRYLQAGSGPPLILLHGMLGYSFSWRFTMPALAPYFTVIAPDMLGAGFSDPAPLADCGMRATARRMLQFVGQLGFTSFDLLGTSHGGGVAILAADECVKLQSPLHVRRLMLVAPVNPYSAHGRRLAPLFGSRIGRWLFHNTVQRMPSLVPYWHQRMYGDRAKIPQGALEGYMNPLAKPAALEHALNIVRTWTADLRELEFSLPRLRTIPTFLMWGSKDGAVYASSAAALAKHFARVSTITFPGVGHLPYEECPDDFNRALLEFLLRTPER